MRIGRLRETVAIMLKQGKISVIFSINEERFDHKLQTKHLI